MSVPAYTREPRTRRDRSGALTASLTSLLEEGELLYREARRVEPPVCLSSFRRSHCQWVLDCLDTLASGFEPESVAEFLRANIPIASHEDPRLAARAAVCVMRDSIEMLRGLRGTLDYDPKY